MWGLVFEKGGTSQQHANECKKDVFNISTTLWKELYNNNSWSFITPTPTIVYSLCHGQRNNSVLSNIGILDNNSTCSDVANIKPWLIVSPMVERKIGTIVGRNDRVVITLYVR
uniref:Uncharacterized protein n=1 Tax=Glossina pallidipes TaxID=7398 RepID=A0A1B0AEH6_GLOPL